MRHVSTVLLTFACAALVAAAVACGGDRPDGHTVNKDGNFHRPGLTDPLTNCVDCHGADLRGGEGPSCFTCHGVKW